MISKNQLKTIRALGQKKQRRISQQFLVQGEKNVCELISSDFDIVEIFATQKFIQEQGGMLRNVTVTEADEDSLSKASTLQSNNTAIAIASIKPAVPAPKKGVIVALDGVSDPGNLGTIIRIADWYGVEHLVISQDCADPYSPKSISATMGSFTRVKVSQVQLEQFLEQTNLPVYGAFLGGSSVHDTLFNNDAIILMGSESHGIREQSARYVTHKITIPSFGQAESLNVAMATGIIMDNLKRTLSR